MKPSTRGQIQMLETVAVIFIFIVLLVISAVVYLNFSKTSSTARSSELLSDRSISTSLKASFLPEIRCLRAGNIVERSCADVVRIEEATPLMDRERDFYFDILGFSTIRINQIFPTPAEFVLYDVQPPGSSRAVQTPVPISLYDPRTQRYGFGVMTVVVYG